MGAPTILDGPMGTELVRRGVDLAGPAWSARAIDEAPEMIGAIHREYADAGATVHTAATFRTQPRILPDRWAGLARRAVEIARASVPRRHLVAGSIAPLADCYRPDLSTAGADPDAARADHLALARVLIDAGCDRLLCETFTHGAEALLAVDAALEAAGKTDAEVWLAVSPGYEGDLMTPAEAGRLAAAAAAMGAGAVLVNCAPLDATHAYVRAIAAAVWGRGVAVGAYANAGRDQGAWRSSPGATEAYLHASRSWADAGATLIGGCCGTGPWVIRALAERLGARA
ncbi:MAG TPA: homocysteine S-methyltransferase family protein [Phycisphaerales bacterium]|nr:homocysteine S-methyltransferase family protein [Phycisphaerales bacterium]